jgi:hypothetical protein
LVQPEIVDQLGMKRDADDRTLADRNNSPIVEASEDVNPWADLFDDRRPNEHGVEGLVSQGREFQVRFEAVDLTPKCVPPHVDVEPIETGRLFAIHSRGQNDHASTGPKNWETFPDTGAEGLVEAVFVHEEPNRRTLAARNDQAVEPRKVFRSTHLGRVHAKLP